MTDNSAMLTDTNYKEKQLPEKMPFFTNTETKNIENRLVVVSLLALLSLPSILFPHLRLFSLTWGVLTLILSVYNFLLISEEKNSRKSHVSVLALITSSFILATTILTWAISAILLNLLQETIK